MVMMSFNDFIHKNNLKNEATSKKKNQHILCSLAVKDVKIKLRDGPFTSDVGIVILHPTERTHGLHTLIKVTSVHLVVQVLKNCLGFFYKRKWALFTF